MYEVKSDYNNAESVVWALPYKRDEEFTMVGPTGWPCGLVFCQKQQTGSIKNLNEGLCWNMLVWRATKCTVGYKYDKLPYFSGSLKVPLLYCFNWMFEEHTNYIFRIFKQYFICCCESVKYKKFQPMKYSHILGYMHKYKQCTWN